MRAIWAAGLGSVLLAACHGATCANSNPRALRAEASQASVYDARQMAINTVYERHPTRALVDFANVEQTGTDPIRYRVHVEMTGSPDARAIYDVDLSETDTGTLSVTGFTKVQ